MLFTCTRKFAQNACINDRDVYTCKGDGHGGGQGRTGHVREGAEGAARAVAAGEHVVALGRLVDL